jgi:hypothetical protein
MRNTFLALTFGLFASLPTHGQETVAGVLTDPGTSLNAAAERARAVARISAVENNRRNAARAEAARRGLPLRIQLPSGRVQEIFDFRGDEPLYLSTQNANAAISTGANLLRTSPHNLSGNGITIGMWDGGSGRAGHQEFGGRLVVKDGASSIDHATHVCGTMIATGVVSSARGMASSATVDSYDWNGDVSEMTSRGATTAGEAGRIYLSNHSYGIVSGWNYVGNGTRLWEWNGSGTTTASVEDDFGRYNSYSRSSDSLAFNAPYYLIFRSAGNERTDNPSAGQQVALSPGGATVASYDPAQHPGGDGNYRGGFDTVGFEAVAKNVITVGSVTDAVTNGLRDPSKAFSSSFSSWGPTDDGRIKPDICANGDGVYSSLNASNTSYGTYSGTSMSSPNATGSAALLVEQFGNLFPGQAMRASTLKGLLIHTADDRGNSGPDYKYGWGLINVKAAADLIRDHADFPAKARITEDQITSSITTRTQSFVWDGVSPISATLSWTDPAAGAVSSSDSRTPRLVNNLDLKIIAPNGTEYSAFVMPFVGTWTQAAMNLPATTGTNNTDNVEQVRIALLPVEGTYQAVVSYSGTLVNNAQNYSLLISGSSVEVAPPLPLAIATVSPNSGLSGNVTIDLTGTSLRADTVVKLARSGEADITATGTSLIGDSLRGTLNLTGAAAGLWDVVATNPDSQTSTLPGAFTVIGAIWSENFDGTVSGWTSQALTGSNAWSLVTSSSQSPTTSYFAPGPSSKSTAALTSPSVAIPSATTNLQLKFWQNRNLQSDRDAGRLEFSINSGAWFDIEAQGSGAAFASNGYNSTVRATGQPSGRSDFASLRAWSGNTNGFAETIVNLTDTAKFAGKNLRIRWVIATDLGTASGGWNIDSIALLGGGDFTNQAPLVTLAADTSSTETVTDPDTSVYQIVRGTATGLAVAASDDGGESNLSYAWAVTEGPAFPVFFSVNVSNAAKNTTVSFEGTGDYRLSVSIRDAQGLTVTDSVNIRIVQTATGIITSPAAVTLAVGSSQPFSASLLDQFSFPMASQPSSFTWTATGGGSVSSSGNFTAGSVGGSFPVTAASGGFSNTSSVTVTPAPATLSLANLNPTYDGVAKSVGITTNPPGLAVSVTYDGSETAPTNTGTYAVEANITDPNYQGFTTGILILGKAGATVTLSGLAQDYDATPKSVTATTIPEGIAHTLTYDGSSQAPLETGTYAVLATITDVNYSGSGSGSLVISPGNTLAAWKSIHFTEAQRLAGLASDDRDPDLDGMTNLAEYALGTSPHVFSPAPLAIRSPAGLGITFSRPADLPDVTYGAESSEDLIKWLPIPLERISTGSTEILNALDPLSEGNPKIRFLRLRFDPK